MSEIITDANGREIEVQLMDTLTRRRFTRNMGKVADSDRWFGEAMLAVQARKIDGVPVPMPTTPDQTDALVAKLDSAGVNAIAAWAETIQPVDTDAAKNSPGTPTS